ncbi:hypothetical protein [Brachybacterium hainanense]|uniref:Lipoprotein n=1 Tax=Brachybacterium hainanense TaxID=1541174 RepID=A0ABV6RDS4_9MICO
MSEATTVRRATSASAIAVAAAALLALAGCSGGSSADGTYYIEDVNGTSNLGQLVVEDGQLTHHEYKCEGVYEKPEVTSMGEFNDDRTQVIWTVAGDDSRNERTGTEQVTVSETSISFGGDVYVKDDSDAGKALLEAFESDCGSEG